MMRLVAHKRFWEVGIFGFVLHIGEIDDGCWVKIMFVRNMVHGLETAVIIIFRSVIFAPNKLEDRS